MKKSIKEQTAKAFQTGGMVYNPQTGTYSTPGTGMGGFQPAQPTNTGYTPYTGTQPYMQPLQYTGTQFTTAEQTTNIPTFGQMVGSGYQGQELRTYVNDAGQVLQIPFVDGKPVYPIPDGYKPKTDQPQQEMQATVTPTTGQTQRDEGGGRDDFDVPSTSITGKGIFSGTTFNSPTSANQAVANEYGITGNRGVNLATVLSVATGNVLGAISSVSGYGPMAGEFMAFGNAPTPGAIGTIDKATLEAIANGSIPTRSEDITSQIQAQNALDAAAVLGVEVTQMGHFGYEPGDAVPGIPGAFMDANGIARDVKTGSVAVGPNGQRAYSSVKAMVDRLSMSREDREKEDSRAGREAVSAEIGRQSRAAEERNRARDEAAGRSPDDRSGSTGAGESKSGGSLADSGTSGKGYSGSGDDFQGPHGTGKSSGPSGPSFDDDAVGRSSGKEDNSGSGSSSGSSGSSSSGNDADDGSNPICLTEDMKVKRNGVIDFVTNVKVGDIVDNTVVTEVIHKHMREGYYVVNGELKITNDHPVLANGSWKRTEDLVLGDYINSIEVTSLEYVDQVTPTVYIGTADDRYDVYTEGEVYTVHGQYKNITKQAA